MFYFFDNQGAFWRVSDYSIATDFHVNSYASVCRFPWLNCDTLYETGLYGEGVTKGKGVGAYQIKKELSILMGAVENVLATMEGAGRHTQFHLMFHLKCQPC